MSEFIWPGAFTVVSIAFFLIFKESLTGLIKRLKSVSREGFDTTDSGTGEQSAQSTQQYLADVQRIKDSYAERSEQQAREIAAIRAWITHVEGNPTIRGYMEKFGGKKLDTLLQPPADP